MVTKHIAPWPQLHSTLFVYVYVWANRAYVAVCVSAHTVGGRNSNSSTLPAKAIYYNSKAVSGYPEQQFKNFNSLEI